MENIKDEEYLQSKFAIHSVFVKVDNEQMLESSMP